MVNQETRTKDVLTTGEVARICRVAPRTVSKWFDSGKLRGYRIPGSGDRRIPMTHLIAFMRAHGLPMDELDRGVCRILLVGPAFGEEIIEPLTAANRLEVRAAATPFSAGLSIRQFRPHVIVLDLDDGPAEAEAICRTVKSSPELETIRVMAVGAELTNADGRHWLGRGFDGCLAKPVTPVRLLTAIEGVTNLVT